MAAARSKSARERLRSLSITAKVDVVAKALGISRKGLYLKRQRLGL